ncbi:ClbS/DfsB family four-helix bundle protein [Klebsiella indica]|uniref:ClbS/DfsB family four-helix bundle protein n=1 Tax=Klebsiella indica TaxID=2582917 RepID=A0A5R9LDN8_9ENTR|nr:MULTISPECIES: ClbS/DfsB family four-helix bundle protein [Klebsiella]TLV11596.1 ClbS/DfsB family four-helix bundle protein [Klebsiella indica]
MSIPQTQAQLLEAIEKNFAKLAGYLAHIPEDKTEEKTLPGHAQGTMMSVRDLVCYLLGWNELVLKWLAHDAAQQPIDFPETDFKWNQLGLLAQKFYLDYPSLDYPSLLTALHQAKRQIIAHIAARNDDALYAHPWYGKWTLGRMISLNTSSPYTNACARLRQWAKEQHVSLK